MQVVRFWVFSEREAQGFLLRRGFDPTHAKQCAFAVHQPSRQATSLPGATHYAGRLRSLNHGAACFVITNELCYGLICAGQIIFENCFTSHW